MLKFSGKNFALIYLLIMLMNFGSFWHASMHTKIYPEVFCTAQHDANTAAHFEHGSLPALPKDECIYCSLLAENNFLTPAAELPQFHTVNTKDNFLYNSFYESQNIFYTSSRAPPVV